MTSHIASLVLPRPQCRWRARVKYKAAVNRFLFLTHPSLLFNCPIKIGHNASCNCRGLPLAHCSLLRISCMSPDCCWGRVALRTVARKCSLQLFTSPKFHHMCPPSLSNEPLVFVLLRRFSHHGFHARIRENYV